MMSSYVQRFISGHSTTVASAVWYRATAFHRLSESQILLAYPDQTCLVHLHLGQTAASL